MRLLIWDSEKTSLPPQVFISTGNEPIDLKFEILRMAEFTIQQSFFTVSLLTFFTHRQGDCRIRRDSVWGRLPAGLVSL